MKLADLLELPGFRDFSTITAHNDFTIPVKNVDILEYEWVNQDFSVFHAGDLVLTSLFFAKDDSSLIEASFARLMEKRVAAIAVKDVFYQQLPSAVIELAEARHTPLFLFHNTYMEDLIIEFNKQQEADNRYRYWEDQLQKLLEAKPDLSHMEDIAHEINPDFLPQLLVFYCTQRQPHKSPRFFYDYLNHLPYKHHRNPELASTAFLPFRSGILILASFAESPARNSMQIGRHLLNAYDLTAEEFHIGISCLHDTFHGLATAIQQALDSCQICRLENAPYRAYQDLHMYQQLVPLSRIPAAGAQLEQVIASLEEYDNRYSSDLQHTLRLYVENHSSIAATAAALYQHPNTIRYRLQKAQSILEPLLGSQDFYEQLFLLFTLDHIRQASL